MWRPAGLVRGGCCKAAAQLDAASESPDKRAMPAGRRPAGHILCCRIVTGRPAGGVLVSRAAAPCPPPPVQRPDAKVATAKRKQVPA